MFKDANPYDQRANPHCQNKGPFFVSFKKNPIMIQGDLFNISLNYTFVEIYMLRSQNLDPKFQNTKVGPNF